MKVKMPSLPRVPVVTHSLRGRLLWFLLAAITMAAIAQAMIAYRSALSDADQIFDYHMQQMAMSLRSSATLTNKAADTAADPENDDLVVQVWTPDGAQVFRSLSRAALPQRAVLGFSNVKANNTTTASSRCRPATRRCRWRRTWRCASAWPTRWRCARSARSPSWRRC